MMRTDWFLAAALALASSAALSPAADEIERAPESRGRLLVEAVLLKPGTDGGSVEVRYRLAGVARLPADPGETFVRDEATGETARVRRVPMLPAVSEHDPAPSRLASFVVPNYGGKFRPGTIVTVSVAGLVQTGVTIDAATPAAPDSTPAPAEPAAGPPQMPAPAPELEILSVKPTANGQLIDIRFKLTGVDRLPTGGGETYVLDPETGARYTPLGVTRIGVLSTKHVDKAGTSFLILKGPEGSRVEPGRKITVVIAGVRRDDVVVEE